MSWLGDYLEYTRQQESPTDLHFWTGLTVLAATMNRRVWVWKEKGGVRWYRVFPGQLMTVLVTPPGKGHKTSAMRVGRDLLKAIGINAISGKGSTEGIIKKILRMTSASPTVGTRISTGQPDAIAFIYSSELSVLLSRQTYAESMIDFLTDAYDADDQFVYTLSNSEYVLNNPCVTLLAAATPTSIGDAIPDRAHGSGFTGRVLHVWHTGEERASDPLIEIDSHDVVQAYRTRSLAARTSLLDRLRVLQTFTGELHFQRDADETARFLSGDTTTPAEIDAAVWYYQWHEKWKGSPEGQGEGYPMRKPDHLLRVAMILGASAVLADGTTQMSPVVYTIPLLDAGLMALDSLEPGFAHAFACIGQNRQAMLLRDRVVKSLQRYGGAASTRQLLNQTLRYFRDIEEFKSATKALADSGIISFDGLKGSDEWWSIPRPTP